MINLSDMGLGLSLAAFLVCLANLVFTLITKRTGKSQNKVFIAQLVILMINAATGMVSTFTDKSKYTSDNAYILLQVSRYVYFLTHALIAPLFYCYTSAVIGRDHRGSKEGGWKGFLTGRKHQIILLLNELFIALNPLTNWIYVFTDDRQFKRAWGEFLFVYGAAALWMVASLILFIKSRTIISKSRKYALASCYLFSIAGVLLQLIYSKFRIEVLMETIGFTGVMFFIENEDDRTDISVGAYNASAFKLDLKAAARNNISAELIIVRNITNESYPVPIGANEGYAPERAVANYLGGLVGRYYVYSIGRGTVAAVVYGKSRIDAGAAAKQVSEQLAGLWEIDNVKLRLNGTVILLSYPERAATVDDVFYIADCPLPENVSGKLMSGSDLDWIVRRAAVEAAVKRGLSQNSFEVYYQPTYTIGG